MRAGKRKWSLYHFRPVSQVSFPKPRTSGDAHGDTTPTTASRIPESFPRGMSPVVPLFPAARLSIRIANPTLRVLQDASFAPPPTLP